MTFFLKILLRNWIFFTKGSEIDLSDKIRLKLARPGTEVTIRFSKKRLIIRDPPGFVRNFEDIFIERIYFFVSDEEDIKIIDCGANIGLSVIFFKSLYPNAHIVAFEPDPDLFNILDQNVRSFGFTGVEVVNAAVWKFDGEIAFFKEGGFSGHILNPTEMNENIEPTSVRCFDLVKLISDDITFLKMDIEGAEGEVIAHLGDRVRYVRHVFVEYHSFVDRPQVLSEILALLERNGFRFYLKQERTPTDPFSFLSAFQQEQIGDIDMDMQIAIFARRT